MFSVLKMRIGELSKLHTDYMFKLQEFNEAENNPFILAVVTPLMKRVHQKVLYFHYNYMYQSCITHFLLLTLIY